MAESEPETEPASLEASIEAREKELFERKQELVELYHRREPEPVGEYDLRRSTGEPVSLADLFGDHDDLVVVHNMGTGCRFCTMWADGFEGFLDHLTDRTAFVVSSPDEPAVQREFAAERGWSFEMVSAAGTDFVEDMGFASEDGYMPGFSTFHREPDGSVVRIASRYFGPGDDFCPPWHFFDVLADGVDGWQPAFEY